MTSQVSCCDNVGRPRSTPWWRSSPDPAWSPKSADRGPGVLRTGWLVQPGAIRSAPAEPGTPAELESQPSPRWSRAAGPAKPEGQRPAAEYQPLNPYFLVRDYSLARWACPAVIVGSRLVSSGADRGARRPVAEETTAPEPAPVRGSGFRPGPQRRRRDWMTTGMISGTLRGLTGESLSMRNGENR